MQASRSNEAQFWMVLYTYTREFTYVNDDMITMHFVLLCQLIYGHLKRQLSNSMA